MKHAYLHASKADRKISTVGLHEIHFLIWKVGQVILKTLETSSIEDRKFGRVVLHEIPNWSREIPNVFPMQVDAGRCRNAWSRIQVRESETMSTAVEILAPGTIYWQP